jgi:DNA-binding HxlR family transcriptional regulator
MQPVANDRRPLEPYHPAGHDVRAGRHFRELLTQSEEGISSNILTDRLKMLLDQEMITKTDDPTHAD